MPPEPSIENPRIEDEEVKKPSDGDEPQKDQEDYCGQMCDDAYENIEIAIQLIENFMTSTTDESLKEERKRVVLNLLIDCNNRDAELF